MPINQKSELRKLGYEGKEGSRPSCAVGIIFLETLRMLSLWCFLICDLPCWARGTHLPHGDLGLLQPKCKEKEKYSVWLLTSRMGLWSLKADLFRPRRENCFESQILQREKIIRSHKALCLHVQGAA